MLQRTTYRIFAFTGQVNRQLFQQSALISKRKKKGTIMERFEDLITSQGPVLIDFYAEWCGPCKAMKPILEELKKMKGERVRIAKIDVDKHKDLASSYRIQSVPTLILFKNGEPVWRQSGVMQAHELKKIIEQYE